MNLVDLIDKHWDSFAAACDLISPSYLGFCLMMWILLGPLRRRL